MCPMTSGCLCGSPLTNWHEGWPDDIALPLWQGRFSDQRLGAGKPAERERELCSGHLPAEFRADAQLQRIRRRRLRGQEIEDGQNRPSWKAAKPS